MAKDNGKVYSLKDYFVNPDADPIKGITALKGKYNSSNFISGVDAAVRGGFAISTAILRNTFNLGSTILRGMGKVDKFFGHFLDDGASTGPRSGVNQARKKIRTLSETLIGTESTDNFFSFVDNEMKEMSMSYKEIGKQLAKVGSTLEKDDPMQLMGGLTSTAMKQMKLTALAFSGYNFQLDNIVRNALIIDIETGGLFKDAPILQIAMGDMSKMEDLKKTLGLSDTDANIALQEQIGKMSPKQQMAKGFLSLNLMPSAIIRDTDKSDPAREATFQAFEYLPKSEKEFKDRFGSWASGKFPWLTEFYEQFGEGPSGQKTISDVTLSEIQTQFKKKGYVTLGSGQRIYSQKEGAKYSMIFAKQAADEGRSLVAANLPYESFRVGKLWEYFLSQRNVPDAFNVSLFDHGQYLNKDKDIIKAFGGPITSLRDMRQMLSATWKSERKRNILDANNYFFTEKARLLKEAGLSEDLISLLPDYVRNVSGKLATRDQLDLTKMLFSGLMQTNFIESSGDVLSGTNVNIASQIVLGFDEAHQALSDVMVQGRLLIEGKLPETLNDVHNIYKARESASMMDQVRGLISSFSILGDTQKQGWLEVAKIKDTKIDMDVKWFGNFPAIGERQGQLVRDAVSGTITGTQSDINRAYNIDKELLRLSETVDSYTGINGLFTPDPAKTITQDYVDDNGVLQTIKINTAMQEAFSLPMPMGKIKHTMLTSEGTAVNITKTQTDWDLQQRISTHYSEALTERIKEKSSQTGVSFSDIQDVISGRVSNPGSIIDNLARDAQIEARQAVKNRLIVQYAEGDNFVARGISETDLYNRLNFLEGGIASRGAAFFTDQEKEALKEEGLDVDAMSTLEEFRSAHLRLRLSGKDGFRKDVDNAVRPIIAAARRRLTSEASGAASAFDYVQNALEKRRKVLKAKGKYEIEELEGPAALVKPINTMKKVLSETRLTIDTVSSLFTNRAGLRKGALSRMSGVSEDIAEYALTRAQRGIALGGMVAGFAFGASANYMIDTPSYKHTTKDILKMTGDEREILEPGQYKKAGSLSSVMVSSTSNIDKMNPNGFALSSIDSSRVDYAIGDADTVEVVSKGFMGMGRRSLGSVRLAGIDAPETAHEGMGGPGDMPFAQKGKQYLSNVLGARTGANLMVGQGSTFGRSMGLVTDASGINYSYEMVNQGLATVLYRQGASEDLVNQKAFNAAEFASRSSDKGMFADPFYYGVHTGVPGQERKGYNVLTPATAHRFNFEKSPGSTKQQNETLQEEARVSANYPVDMSYNDYNQIFLSINSRASDRKNVMADMQTVAMANALERNRGRSKERR